MSEMSNQIYDQIQQQINILIDELSKQQHENRLTEDVSAAMANLTILNNQIQNELEKLKAFSEWKRFTIAFYGETNAGKSTLIEALRLLLNEPSKQESQRKFKELQKKSGLTQEAFDKIRQIIMGCEASISTIEKELNSLKQKFAEPRMLIGVEIKRLSNLIEETKTNRTFLQKLFAFFSTMPEEKELSKFKNKLINLNKEQVNEQKKNWKPNYNLWFIKNKKQNKNNYT